MEQIFKEKKQLFNPHGSDEISDRRMIGGNSTNLFNLENTKYKWANGMYTTMQGNHWIPEKVDMGEDAVDYKTLTKHEKRAYDEILSFLIFLDSIQTVNLPNIADYITAPEVSVLLAIQTFQEAIHSKSYAHIVQSVIPAAERNKVYEYWKNDKILLGRNKYIADIYQEHVDNPSNESLAKVIMANFILEGLYFYNGFNFFYSLSARHKMNATAEQIRYIQRDELTHVSLFTQIIRELNTENPGFITPSLAYEMMGRAVEMEIEWGNHILGDNILGINQKSTEEYTKYLANKRLASIGFSPLYEGDVKNPYKHLNKQANENGDVKSNFFEATVTDYNQSSVVDGWEEI